MDQQQIDDFQQGWLIAQVDANPRALQIGCGMKPIEGAVNLDPNPDRWPWANVAADGHRLPFADGAFGCVVSSHVLPHLHHPVRALREMARILRPGGMIAHVVPDLRYAPRRFSTRYPFANQPHGWDGPDDFWSVMDQVRDVFRVIELEDFHEFNWSFKLRAVSI